MKPMVHEPGQFKTVHKCLCDVIVTTSSLELNKNFEKALNKKTSYHHYILSYLLHVLHQLTKKA